MKIFIPAGVLLVLSAVYVYLMQPTPTPRVADTDSASVATVTATPTTSSLAAAKGVDDFAVQLEADMAKDMDADLEVLTADDSEEYATTVGAEEF